MSQRAFIVVDLGYGDSGKGTITEYLACEHKAHTVIRYNGGSQAAHFVVLPDGRFHEFSQFGSASFLADTQTFLSKYMLVDPVGLMGEAQALKAMGLTDICSRIKVDERALIVTPFQVAANRLRETMRGNGRHGSCGKGIGETQSDFLNYGDQVLFAGDLKDRRIVEEKLRFIRQRKQEQLEQALYLPLTPETEPELDMLWGNRVVELCLDTLLPPFIEEVEVADRDYLSRILRRNGNVVFEGAQGVLLDEWHGFHPYTTWSTTTTRNARALLLEAGYQGQTTKVGVVRGYATRHGAGPFVSESQYLTEKLPDMHNGMNRWQREFRVGHFDLVATKYALAATRGVDVLAVTCLDRLKEEKQPATWICAGYTTDSLPREFCKSVSGGRVTELRISSGQDLEYQERLTNFLMKCRPWHEAVGDLGDFLAYLQVELKVPVAITSWGPTLGDKKLTPWGALHFEASHQL